MTHVWRWLIIAFCLWHMLAIAVYIVPDEAKDKPSQKFEELVLPYARPYMYATSQWQKWNIFSPNPLRRVSFYRVELNVDGTWTTTISIKPKDIPWWKRSRELKLLRRMEDGGDAAALTYLAFLCRNNYIPRGAEARVMRDYYVIPTIKEVRDVGGWPHVRAQTTTDILATSTCTAQ